MGLGMLQNIASIVSGILGRESRLVRVLRPGYVRLLELATQGRGFDRKFNGHECFHIDPRHRGYFPEIYEPTVCDFLRNHVRPGAISLNVGAHVGFYALSLAWWSRPEGRVFAFEPNPLTRALLANHVERNGFKDQIEIMSQAISDAPGEATFYAAGVAGFNRLGQPNPERHETHSPIRVQVTTIDEFCITRGVSPDWLLMDIEGYEVAALKGAFKTIKAGRNHLGILVEMHPFLWKRSGTTRRELELLLDAHGLKAVPLTGQPDPLAENGVAFLEYV